MSRGRGATGSSDARTFDETDGTEQEERRPLALEPGYFGVGELGLGELLRVAARMASNLVYRNRENEADGSWADFYLESEAYVLAEIASLDPDRLRWGFARLGRRGDRGARARHVRSLAVNIDRWLRVLRRSEHREVAGLARTLSAMVSRDLAPALHAAGRLLAEEGEEAGAGYRTFRSDWGLEVGPRGAVSFPRAELPADPADRAEQMVYAYDTLLNAVSYLAGPAAACFQAVRTGGRVDPAMGLVLTFVELVLRSRERLNDFPERRLAFYYGKVLKMEPRARVPDRAHLVLAPAAAGTAVRVPPGTAFNAGRGPDQKDIVFASEEPVVVTDARVVSLRSLYYERDPLVSPERELGFVTRVLGGTASGDPSAEPDGSSSPLFDPTGPGSPYSSEGISLGFAVESPILDLAEGSRRLLFDLELGPPLGAPARSVDAAIAALDEIPDGRSGAFFDLFGQIFSQALLSCTGGRADQGRSWLTSAQADAVRRAAVRILDEADSEDADSLEVVEDLLGGDPLVLFHELFRTALMVRFTGASGWERAEALHVGPLPGGTERAGLRVELSLGPDVGPVVPFARELHGTRHQGRHPIVSFRVNPQAIFFPFSLLDSLTLRSVDVEVQVHGVTDLVVHNGLGQLDATKPFQPFGPLPSLESYLVVGSYEAARKKLVEGSLEVEWGELPSAPGGFRQHYHLYGRDVTNDAFRAEVAVLRDGRWEPADPEQRPDEPLFDTEGDGGRVARHARIPLEVMELFVPLHPGVSAEEYRASLRGRQGLFRLSLAPSRATFGHREYAKLLTEVLTRNAKRRKPEPVPEPPYTPLVSRISLDYVARTSIRAGAEPGEAPGEAVERILHEHAYGIEDLTASPDEAAYSLMPGRPALRGPGGTRLLRDGYLFLGLSGSSLSGALSLLFHLRHDAAGEDGPSGPETVWFYLAANRWKPLESYRILGDTTDGFQTSGIVTLDLPDDVATGSTILPGDLYWLAVGGNQRVLSLVSRLLHVSAGAVEVVWQDRGNDRPDLARGLPARSITRSMAAVPGLGSVTQVGATFGGKAAEDPEALVTRTAERLRHKNRAVSVWDYERLVLERFPEVHQVKVFPGTDPSREGPAPGRVLVVVVPKLIRREDDRTLTPRLAGGELSRIRRFLSEVSSGFAVLDVRNPVYEQVQIRCSVKLTAGSRAGYCVQDLNEALVDFISPWRPGGYGARFGWRMRRKDIEARIRELPYVEFVTNFSMLQITLDGRGRHSLDDTARPGTAPWSPEQTVGVPSTATHELVARYPWSLAVPIRRHFIETTPGDVEIPPEVTGIGELEIGTNFILDAGHRHG